MKRLRLLPNGSNDYEGYGYDVKEIVEACERLGYVIDMDTAYAAWKKFSRSMAAGWMSLYSGYGTTDEECDQYILNCIRPYLMEEEM